jgi:hypothetical protein
MITWLKKSIGEQNHPSCSFLAQLNLLPINYPALGKVSVKRVLFDNDMTLM